MAIIISWFIAVNLPHSHSNAHKTGLNVILCWSRIVDIRMAPEHDIFIDPMFSFYFFYFICVIRCIQFLPVENVYFSLFCLSHGVCMRVGVYINQKPFLRP